MPNGCFRLIISPPARSHGLSTGHSPRPHTSHSARVVTIGGGPAGLYFALLLKKANPGHEVIVLERNAPGDTFGWGVVFSDQTLDNFRDADEESHRRIVEHFAHWDDIDVVIGDTTITSGGHGFSGIARRTLLDILRRRAESLGVDVRFNCNVQSIDAVTPDDVARVAKKYIHPDRVAVVVVGDRKVIEPGVSSLNLGPLHVLTLDDVFGPAPAGSR